MIIMLNNYRFGRLILSLILFVLTCSIQYNMQLPLFANVTTILIIGILLVDILVEFIVIQIFKQPTDKKPSIENESWTELTVNCRGVEARALLNRGNDSGRLLLVVHGWKGSAESVRERAEWFCQQGWHALIVEMPGHGLAMPVNKWTAIRVVEHTVELMKSLDNIIPPKEITDIVYYGHSMGGFVGINLSKTIEQYSWGHKLRGWILESPMTKYSMVFNDSMSEMKIPIILHQLVKKRFFSHLNRLHPNEKPIESLTELDVPTWGLPKRPTLVIQAADDNVLGREHYDLLISSMSDAGREELLTTHLLQHLPHAGARTDKVRSDIVEEWINKLLPQ